MSNRGLDLKRELVRLVRTEYRARVRDVKVFTADPRVKEDLPCIAVNRIYDSEDNPTLANFYDQELTPAGDGTVENFSGLFTQTCELRIWTENADTRDEMYVELKEILLLAKQTLAARGFGNLILKGGRDENDFRTYSPLMLYWGVFNFSALAPFDAFNAPDATAPKIDAVDTKFSLDGVEQTQADLEAQP